MFDAAVVVIEASGPQPPAYVAAAVQGCSSALGDGACTRAESKSEPSTPWRAVLHALPDSDPRLMVIEVRREGSVFRRRELRFTRRDQIETRWSTAGAVVAAIISGELEQQSKASGDVAAGGAEEPRATDAEPFSPNDYSSDPIDSLTAIDVAGRSPFRVEGAAVELLMTGGAEVYQGPPELGAVLRAKFALAGGPFVFVGAGGSAVPDNPLIVQSDGFVGLGVPIPINDASAIDLGASFVSEWLWVWHETESGRSDSAARWRFGGGLDADFRLRLAGPWAGVVGGRATFLWPEVDIRRPPRQLAVVLPVGLGLVLGVRYDFSDGSL